MRVVLLSTYELGRQPFGLASATAWLRAAGHDVSAIDAGIDPIDAAALRSAESVGFYLPMHTATRVASVLVPRIRQINPDAKLFAFGLYAPAAEPYLREHGVAGFFGGEFEPGIVGFLESGEPASAVLLDRLQFRVPDRSALPPIRRYSKLNSGGRKMAAGYTEASRGCKHLCRHCPIVPVYDGKFRVVQAEVVLADIRQQVAAGAQHITFGDPDFLNGPTHARHIVEALHREFPLVTYDATIKVEHLIRHADMLPLLRSTGCIFVTTAVESLDDGVLALLRKGHTRTDFERAVELARASQLALNPTFIAFTLWTTRESYLDLIRSLIAMDLIDAVSPIQLALRLLIPLGSPMLELDDIQAVVQPFDAESLVYPWRHPDPAMDALSKQALHAVWAGQKAGKSRRQIAADLWEVASGAPLENLDVRPRATIPYMDEPWYC